jgi:hypothetical protein
VLAPPLPFFHREGVGSDERELLEIERRPFEAARHLDAQRDDRPARARHPHSDLERPRRGHRVVDDIDATVQHRQPAPGFVQLRTQGSRNVFDHAARGLVSEDVLGAEIAGELRLVRVPRHGEHPHRWKQRPQDGDGEQP